MYFANTRLLTSARQSYGKHKKNIYMPNFESYDVFKNVVKISSEKKGFFTPIRNVISSILGQVIDYSVLNLSYFNHLTPNDHFSGRTAPLTYRCCNFFIYLTDIRTEYFKHAAYSPFFPLQNVVYFIVLPFLVPVLYTF